MTLVPKALMRNVLVKSLALYNAEILPQVSGLELVEIFLSMSPLVMALE